MSERHGSDLRTGGLLAAIGHWALVAGDRRYAIAAAKGLPHDATHLQHARCWRRPDSDRLADPNPFELHKRRAGQGG